MSGETSQQLVVGLLENLLASAHAGKIEAIAVVVAGSQKVQNEDQIIRRHYVYVTGRDVGPDMHSPYRNALQRGINDLRYDFGNSVWDRIPQGPSLP